MAQEREVSSGIPALDEVVQGLRLGDNVVWQVDELEDYLFVARPFAEISLAEGRQVVYVRFAPHPPVLEPREGLEILEVDPSPGFDHFSRAVHELIEERGERVFYVFDSLSALVTEWATDELVANFFQVTCPYLFELDTVAYFALQRGQHAHSAVARIRETTQLLVDLYHADGERYVHPLKVWERYTPQMFLPHRVAGERWAPVFYSGEAAGITSRGRQDPLQLSQGTTAPWETAYRRLAQYRGREVWPPTDPELVALKRELCRMMLGTHPDFNELADRYFTVEDLLRVRERLIGSGRIGGKAAGMLLARRVLLTPEPGQEVDFAPVLEEHDSFYLGADVFFTFLVHNGLFRLRLQLTEDSRLSHEEFAEVEQRFLAGSFPPEIMEQFRSLLEYFGQAPIIVRSSSLLEDSFGNAFAGKYRSEFCANQGSPEERLRGFLRAVKLVYASALNPDALAYRRKRGLGESDEQMAILVQRVSGRPHGRFFYPTLAGVAFSRNLYVWTDRLDPRQGLIRVVFGLGTRAVERVGGDYPRMIAVSHPLLRPETGMKVARYSQQLVDLLDLGANALVTLPLDEALSAFDEPNLHLLVSELSGDHLSDPVGRLLEVTPRELVLTCNNLLRRTDFVPVLGAMLTRLEQAYGRPVDTEFTATVTAEGQVRVNLLQCRPLLVPGAAAPVRAAAPGGRTLLRSRHMIGGGVVEGLRYIVYVDPRRYSALADESARRTLGRIVGKLNEHPEVVEGKVMMLGPGRWGSSNLDLGVNVGYGDIDNAAVLVEIAREEAGHRPEVSYGTHFFQDLVEAEILYLALFPDEEGAEFDEEFLRGAPNALAELLPEAARFAELIQVVDVPAVTGGARVRVVADPQAREAVAWVE